MREYIFQYGNKVGENALDQCFKCLKQYKIFVKPQHPTIDNQELADIPEFKPFRLIAFVLILLLGISFWLKWYTGAVSLPRYCENPADTMHYLEKVLTEKTPAKDEPRKPYLIAAKLIYLIPQQRNETVPDYLDRLKVRLGEQCRR